MTDRTYNVLHVFAGIGGGCLGFADAQAEFRGVRARFETVGAIDVDPDACADLELLTGRPATRLDLFTRDDYRAFHGAVPPEGWREATPADIRAACGGQRPDVVFGSPPCKGFSGLLSKKRARSERYAALNNLVCRWLFLVLEAFAEHPPGLLLLENVPRIRQRGRSLLDRVQAMLASYGYACSETVHDCGELGGLAQTRKRFLLVARHTSLVPALLYEPPPRRLRTIGDVIEALPMPEDADGGAMHALPRIQWKTWVRLALIRAGKDWRDLAERWEPDAWGVVPDVTRGQRYNNVYWLVDFREASPAVTGGTGPSAGGLSVADPRAMRYGKHSGKMRVESADGPAHTITGSDRVGSGALSVADPRTGGGRWPGAGFGVLRWEGASRTVTCTPDIQAGGLSIADPRPGRNWHKGVHKVSRLDETSCTITGRAGVTTGAFSIADPRTRTKMGPKSVTLRMKPWSEPGPTVTGNSSVWDSGGFSVADPRPNWRARNGTMGVQLWDERAATVTGSLDVQSGPGAVADPRELDTSSEPVVIISDDGTWHRPLSTLELAALQSFPTEVDGRALVLTGQSSTRWRMGIGNAVPPAAAKAVAEQMLRTLLVGDANAFVLDGDGGGVWVRERGVLRWHASSRQCPSFDAAEVAR